MSNDKSTPIESIMTPLPFETKYPSSTILDIANKMSEKSKGAINIIEVLHKQQIINLNLMPSIGKNSCVRCI
jgi:hypothetical protein